MKEYTHLPFSKVIWEIKIFVFSIRHGILCYLVPRKRSASSLYVSLVFLLYSDKVLGKYIKIDHVSWFTHPSQFTIQIVAFGIA